MWNEVIAFQKAERNPCLYGHPRGNSQCGDNLWWAGTSSIHFTGTDIDVFKKFTIQLLDIVLLLISHHENALSIGKHYWDYIPVAKVYQLELYHNILRTKH